MSERIQDQRPVFMGTFSKYTRAFESRVSLMENDVEYHKKTIKKHVEKMEDLERSLRWRLIIGGTALLAILVLQFFK